MRGDRGQRIGLVKGADSFEMIVSAGYALVSDTSVGYHLSLQGSGTADPRCCVGASTPDRRREYGREFHRRQDERIRYRAQRQDV